MGEVRKVGKVRKSERPKVRRSEKGGKLEMRKKRCVFCCRFYRLFSNGTHILLDHLSDFQTFRTSGLKNTLSL